MLPSGEDTSPVEADPVRRHGTAPPSDAGAAQATGATVPSNGAASFTTSPWGAVGRALVLDRQACGGHASGWSAW